MATWDDVRRLALALPEAMEEPLHDQCSWRVRGKLFVWERPLNRRDLARFGDQPAPEGQILGARVESEEAKVALIASDPETYFTIAHFDGYSAILVRLDHIPLDELKELIVEAWLLRAPKRLAQQYISEHDLD